MSRAVGYMAEAGIDLRRRQRRRRRQRHRQHGAGTRDAGAAGGAVRQPRRRLSAPAPIPPIRHSPGASDPFLTCAAHQRRRPGRRHQFGGRPARAAGSASDNFDIKLRVMFQNSDDHGFPATFAPLPTFTPDYTLDRAFNVQPYATDSWTMPTLDLQVFRARAGRSCGPTATSTATRRTSRTRATAPSRCSLAVPADYYA